SKPSPALGTKRPVPLEVVSFGLATTQQWLTRLGSRPEVRRRDDGEPFRTDQGNLIIDAHFGPIDEPSGLAPRFAEHAGIVEHGLFIGLAEALVVAHRDGTVDVTTRP